jgi:hypothetical protein
MSVQCVPASTEIRKLVPRVLDAMRTIGHPATVKEVSEASGIPLVAVGKVLDYATASLEVEIIGRHQQIIHVRPNLWQHWPGYNPARD